MRALDFQMLTMRFEEFIRRAGFAPRRGGRAQLDLAEKQSERLAEPTAFLLAIRPR